MQAPFLLWINEFPQIKKTVRQKNTCPKIPCKAKPESAGEKEIKHGMRGHKWVSSSLSTFRPYRSGGGFPHSYHSSQNREPPLLSYSHFLRPKDCTVTALFTPLSHSLLIYLWWKTLTLQSCQQVPLPDTKFWSDESIHTWCSEAYRWKQLWVLHGAK